MVFKLGDRVQETSTAPGTGNFTMNGAVQGAQSFASVLLSNGDKGLYTAFNGTAWENGELTRVSATVYSRATPDSSSNGGALVNFSTGSVAVWMDQSATYTEALRYSAYSALVVSWGANRGTNPVLSVDFNTASVATGIKVTGAAAAAGAAVSVTSSGSNESLKIDAKGSGTISFGSISTGNISLGRPTTIAGTVAISDATASTSSGTGALTVAGGVGAAKAIYGGDAVLSTSPTAGVGYATGAGSTVTQATSKATAVTLNKVTGLININGAALGAGASVSFLFNNSTITATDLVVVNAGNFSTGGSYRVQADSIFAGGCVVTITNTTAGSLSEALTVRFGVLKSVNA